MLAELRESDATGEIAGIYEQIRRLWAVPYVSSLQRHLATRPGWLEWAWAALGPAFTSGVAQGAAWRAADGLAVPRLAPLSRDALAGVGRGRGRRGGDPRDLRELRPREPGQPRAVGPAAPAPDRRAPARRQRGPARLDAAGAAGPAACARRSRRPAGRGARGAGDARHDRGRRRSSSPASTGCWRRGPPSSPTWRRCCGRISTTRPPARPASGSWPRWTRRSPACSPRYRPCPRGRAIPPAAEFAEVLAALDTYRKTSPEMVVFGRMLGDALPRP